MDSLLAAGSKESGMDVPEVARINQSKKNSTINHIALKLRHEVEQLGRERKVKVGETVAICPGNVELTKIVDLLSPLVEKLRQLGVHPYIFIPEAVTRKSGIKLASNSSNYESLEVFLGCPIHRATAANLRRRSPEDIPPYLEELIFISDHIVVINEITSDSSVKNFVLPGMQDMLCQKEGQIKRLRSLRDPHEELLYSESHEQASHENIRRWPILFGVGIIEDKDGHTEQVKIISFTDLFNDKR